MLGEEIQTYKILYLQPDRVAGGLGERAPCCLSSLWNVSKELHVKQYTWAPKCQAIKILPPPSVPRFQMSAWYPIVSGLCLTFLCHSDQIKHNEGCRTKSKAFCFEVGVRIPRHSSIMCSDTFFLLYHFYSIFKE